MWPGLAAHAAAMPLADGLDQCQAKTDTAITVAGARQAIKRLKNTFALVGRHARAVVMQSYHGQVLCADAILRQRQWFEATRVVAGVKMG